MTNPSERELRHTVESLDETPSDGSDTIILDETIVGTGWAGSDLEPGDTETTRREIEL
jgi:hypothetical protein